MVKWLRLIAASLAVLLMASAQSLASDFQYATLSADVGGTKIPVYLYKPPGKGPFPVVILSHGSPRLPQDRLNYHSDTLEKQALAFVEDGAAAAVVVRRGYGGNGKWVEGYQTNCTRPNYYDAGLVSAQDIDAALKVVVKDPEIDRSRIVLVGHSAGGFASVAAATRQKVMGVISFAGGRGSLEPDKVACEDQLVAAMRSYGHASHVPELWIYAQNDHFFGPRMAAELHDAFVSGGAKASLINAPPYGNEGHAYVFNVAGWKPQVDAFLKQIGFYR